MNSEVHPVVVAVVLILTGVAVAIWTWGSGVSASFGGPAELGSSPNGHSFVQIQNYLVEHDSDGAYFKTHDLEEFDIEVLLGGYGFFSNGDILLRRGPDPRSFLDNFRAYGRETNRNHTTPETPDSGLFRCNLENLACERFGEQGIDFKASYSVFVDWRSDEVYISDTTRHLLRKYSSDGVEQAKPVGGFKFPNQLMLHDGQLLVADTNHHVIRAVSPQSSAFAEFIDSNDVVPGDARTAQQTWPSHFAHAGENWWVNNMKTGMNLGGLYIFDREWRFVRAIDLPPRADPISILAVGDEVWVSDWNNDLVRRFSLAGEPLADLKSAGLESILTSSRQERHKYRVLSYSGFALLSFVLLGLITRAFALSMNKTSIRRPTSADTLASGTLEELLQLEPDERARKRLSMLVGIAGLLAVVLGVSLAYILGASDKPGLFVELVFAIAGLLAIVALIYWANRANWGTSIRLEGNTLTLRDYAGRRSSCNIRDVRYDQTAIATRDAVVILGRPKARVYRHEDVQERLLPRLTEAQRIGPIRMLQIMVQLWHPQGIITVLATVGILIYGAVALLSGG